VRIGDFQICVAALREQESKVLLGHNVSSCGRWSLRARDLFIRFRDVDDLLDLEDRGEWLQRRRRTKVWSLPASGRPIVLTVPAIGRCTASSSPMNLKCN
jgi:hypothetical protein